MPDIVFTEKAFEEYMEWQKDKPTIRRINELIKDILRTPFEGKGKPEPLKHELSGCWSRRINEEDRLIYEPGKDQVTIIQCKGHYE